MNQTFDRMGAAPAASPITLVNGVLIAGGAAALVAVDLLLRGVLPGTEPVALPLMTFCAGAFVRSRLSGRERAAPPAKNTDDRIDRAMAELGRRPAFSAPAAEVIAFPAAHAPNGGAERAASELDQYHLFTDILSRQMLSVTALTEESAASILANLTGVDNQISALLAFIQQSGSNDQTVKVVMQIEAQMKACQDLLDRFASTQAADARASHDQRSKIAAETGRVLDVLESVDGIARQTTMLSFNVSIEAARAGEVGRGFAVIGDEIRKLAGEVRDLSKEVRERVETLMQTVTVDLKQKAEQREQTESSAVANIAETLNALTDNLTTLITHQRDILSKVESENESVARPIMAMMGSIQFQDIIRQQIEQLIRMAETVGDHMRALSGMLGDARDDAGLASLSQKLDKEFDHYVMDSQREMHRSATGAGAAQAAGAKIELF